MCTPSYSPDTGLVILKLHNTAQNVEEKNIYTDGYMSVGNL